MDDSSSVSDTKSASVNSPGTPYSESRGIAYKRSSQEFRTNLEIICAETRTLTKRVLTTVYEIHRAALDRLNLGPNFSSQQCIST